MRVDDVAAAAARARAAGADRFCIGAAWREASDGPAFDQVLAMIGAVKAEGLETCATLGMLDRSQAERLRNAGLDYYNHNLDTGRAFYGSIITTRTYDDRLATLREVRHAGIKVCCGGILGMGETHADRIDLLWELARQEPYPESVPINTLVPVGGTPLGDQPPVPWDEVVRVIAAARILMPAAKVRLSAGRMEMGEVTQALCFLAGANSILPGRPSADHAEPRTGHRRRAARPTRPPQHHQLSSRSTSTASPTAAASTAPAALHATRPRHGTSEHRASNSVFVSAAASSSGAARLRM